MTRNGRPPSVADVAELVGVSHQTVSRVVSRFLWWLQRFLVKEFVAATLGRVCQGGECPARREACQARRREYARSLADGLNVTQAAHAVGVSLWWIAPSRGVLSLPRNTPVIACLRVSSC